MMRQPTQIRLQYEQTLTTCSRRLLGSHYEEDPLTEVLMDLQVATSIRRISLFENFTHPNQGLGARCTHQVVSPDIFSPQFFPQEWIYQPRLSRWQNALSQGQLIKGQLIDFTEEEQQFLQPLEISSLLLVPIEVIGEWFGFIAFDDMTFSQDWSADEIYLLQNLTELIGIYLTRCQHQNHWREHEARYHSVIAAMQEGVVLQYADGRVGTCNASAQRILGISANHLIGLTAIDPRWRLIYEDGMPFPEDQLPAQITLKTGQTCSNVVIGVYKPNGHLLWLSVNSQPLWRDGQKKPYAVVSTLTDITKRKKIEDALALSEKRFRAIFNSAAVAITLTNPEGEFIQFNTTWLDMLGYTSEEMYHKKNIELSHPDDLFALEILTLDFKHSNLDHCRTEIRFVHKNGKVLWGDLFASALRNNKGYLDAIISIVIDISERKQIEDERDRLFNLSVDMQCVIGFDGFFKQLNFAWEQSLGWSREHLLAKPLLAFVHPEDQAATRSMCKDLLQGQPILGFENRYRCCQNDNYRWFSWNAYPLVEQERIYAIIRDSTDRKRNEEALAQAHERLLMILDSLDSLVYVADMENYEILYVNKYGQNIFGQINGQLCWKTLHHEQEQPFKQKQPCRTCNNNQLLDSKGEPAGVYTNEIQDKVTKKWYLTRDRAIRWVDGRLVRLQIATDITEQKRTQEALKISEHRYRAIVQDQTELICRYLPDGRLIFVNEAYCRYFNKTEAELIVHHFTPFTFDEMQDVIVQMMDALSRKTPVVEMEHSLVIHHELRWQHWVGRAMFDENDKLVEYQMVGRDITERKQAEEELLRAKETAEAATRAKSQFLANMSHEIRTPMNGVVGMTELLLNTELTPKQREYAEIIHQSTDALQTLINDILDFSKIEAGKLTLELAPFDLEAAVLEVARLLSMTAESKGFELIVRYAPTAPRHFIGDAGRIRQIIMNLVGNAIKFTHQGHVLIDVDCQVQTFETVCMIFKIEDTGIGIPSDKLETIFDKFTQADASTTRQYGGTGLGLAISQQIVKMMNGEIGVVSEIDKGSKFTFTLPLSLAKVQVSEAKSNRQNLTTASSKELQGLQNTKVLVVDDNPINQKILIEQLEDLQIRVRAVESAEKALIALHEAQKQQDPYWLAILDYLMPVMDGEQLGRLIKTDPAIQNTILVMLSSAGYHQESARLQKVGFSGHLIKPLPQYQLQQALLTLRSVFEEQQNTPSDQTVPLKFITMEQVNKFQFESLKKHYFNLPILLVEDNEVNRMVAVNMLEQLGCQVTQVENGKQALNELERHRYPIIFMDIQMPEMDGLEATRRIREQEATQPENYQSHIIVAMTANAMQGDAERCLAVGMNDYIAKPVSLERLFKILNKYGSPPQTQDKLQHRHRILLVEDNPVNCLVATHMLEEIGCLVEVVENGQEAVNTCANKTYDLILMDIQMPIMDGIEATQQIRQKYHSKIPIVAITANAQLTDVQHYLSVGMNDCLAKPLMIERLRSVLDKYISVDSLEQKENSLGSWPSEIRQITTEILTESTETSSTESTETVFDIHEEFDLNEEKEVVSQELECLVGLPIFEVLQAKRIAIGNINILNKIIEKFQQDTPKQLEKLKEALQAGHQADLTRFAHSIKGSARSVGALRLGEVAFMAEMAAKEGDLTQVQTLIQFMANEFNLLQSVWKKTDWNTLL